MRNDLFYNKKSLTDRLRNWKNKLENKHRDIDYWKNINATNNQTDR